MNALLPLALAALALFAIGSRKKKTGSTAGDGGQNGTNGNGRTPPKRGEQRGEQPSRGEQRGRTPGTLCIVDDGAPSRLQWVIGQWSDAGQCEIFWDESTAEAIEAAIRDVIDTLPRDQRNDFCVSSEETLLGQEMTIRNYVIAVALGDVYGEPETTWPPQANSPAWVVETWDLAGRIADLEVCGFLPN